MPHSHKFKLKIITSGGVGDFTMVTKRKNHMKNFEKFTSLLREHLNVQGDFVLKFYPYLEGEGVKKKQIEEFIEVQLLLNYHSRF